MGRRLAVLVLLLVASCSKFLDVTVANPCASAGVVVVGWWEGRPSIDRAADAVDGFTASDNAVPAESDVVIESEVGGDLPFEGGWGIIRWDGSNDVHIFRVPPSNVEPVPVRVPSRLCR